MHLLERTKYSFLFCLGMSTIISVIYFLTRSPPELKPLEPKECRPFSSECQVFLPSTEEGLQWHRRGCQVQSIIKDNLQCSTLIRDLHFITQALSPEEEQYPLAFILTVHKELEIFVRLLRAIYMPQNIYCIHIDAKAPPEYQEAVRTLINCFENTFISSRSETVTYAGFTRLQADLNCMKDLAESDRKWKKVVNLCGQDFPIKSNLELVRYLQSKEWKDRNMTPGIKQPDAMKHRTELQHVEITGSHVAQKGLGQKKDPPPHNLEVYFGTAYYALTRDFVDFVLNNHVALDLLDWSKDTFSPDEHYWVTLNHIPDAPGNHINGGWEGDIRSIKWKEQEGDVHDGCKGHYVRNICIYGMDDLQWIINKNSMFANKFESATSPEALDCLEQWHRNKVLKQASVPIEPLWLLATQGNWSDSYIDMRSGV